VLAHLVAAIRSAKSSIALAAHGRELVPQLVDVAVVRRGELTGRLADAVARARVGARSTLTGNTVVAIEALAFTSGSIAITFVRALHIIVGRVNKICTIGVLHVGELLGRTVRVIEAVLDNFGCGIG